MSLESSAVRKNKRIVEYIIRGFETAKDAIVFGDTVNAIVQEKVVNDFVKFKQQIGSPNTKLAITEDWKEETVLKMHFLEINDHNTSMFIVNVVKEVIASHQKVHGSVLDVIDAIVREKPQPQFMTR